MSFAKIMLAHMVINDPDNAYFLHTAPEDSHMELVELGYKHSSSYNHIAY